MELESGQGWFAKINPYIVKVKVQVTDSVQEMYQVPLGPVHTALLAIALGIQKMGG